MVTEYHNQHLDEAGGSLNDMFGTMTTLNSVVAILAGLFAESLSDISGTQTTPFLTAIVFLSLAFVAISRYWVSPSNNQLPTSNSRTKMVTERKLWGDYGSQRFTL